MSPTMQDWGFTELAYAPSETSSWTKRWRKLRHAMLTAAVMSTVTGLPFHGQVRDWGHDGCIAAEQKSGESSLARPIPRCEVPQAV